MPETLGGLSADEFMTYIKEARDEVYQNLPEGWYAGPWGVCEMCKLGILDGEVGFRTKHGFAMHSRCMVGAAGSAPPDDIDGIKEEIKELLNG